MSEKKAERGKVRRLKKRQKNDDGEISARKKVTIWAILSQIWPLLLLVKVNLYISVIFVLPSQKKSQLFSLII